MVSIAAATLLLAGAAQAEDSPGGGAQVPYWASLTVNEANMRVGPAEDYRILWVYKRKHLPLKVIRVHEGWRQVEDPDGAQGWVLSRFLSRARTAYVTDDQAVIRERPSAAANALWRLEKGVVGNLGRCSTGWCQLEVDGRNGFVSASAIWGDD